MNPPGKPSTDHSVRLSACTVDLVRLIVKRDDGQDFRLTSQEADAFRYLASHPNQDVSREDLLEHVWGYHRDLMTRAVDNTIARLRAKVEHDTRNPIHVLTIRGKGYRLVLPKQPSQTPYDSRAVSPLRSIRGGTTAPEGEVAIVAAMVVGADALWQAIPDVMAKASEVCDRLMRLCLIELNGYEVRSDGTGFLAAFPSPSAAVQWAVDAQLALGANRWSRELLDHLGGAQGHGLRVSMGIDLGSPLHRRDPVTRRMEYFGSVVNCAQQLARLAHGGEVLATAGIAHPESVPADVDWQQMGAIELVADSGVDTSLILLRHPQLSPEDPQPLDQRWSGMK